MLPKTKASLEYSKNVYFKGVMDSIQTTYNNTLEKAMSLSVNYAQQRIYDRLTN